MVFSADPDQGQADVSGHAGLPQNARLGRGDPQRRGSSLRFGLPGAVDILAYASRTPGGSPSGSAGISSVPDGVDLHGVLVLVDAVDDPVGPAPRGVVTVEGFIKWLADPVRACRERPVDRLHGSGSDLKRQILVQVAPGLPGEDDRVRSSCLWSGRSRIAGHDVPRRRRSSSART